MLSFLSPLTLVHALVTLGHASVLPTSLLLKVLMSFVLALVCRPDCSLHAEDARAAKRARISRDLAVFADGLTSGDLATWSGNLRYAMEHDLVLNVSCTIVVLH